LASSGTGDSTAMQRTLLQSGQRIDVMAGGGRGRRDAHALSRPRAGMHAEAVVQAREKRPHRWPWMASREASPRACVASHSDVSHGPARPDHEVLWLMCFVYGAWVRVQARYQRLSAILKHGSLLHMSSCMCCGRPRGLVQASICNVLKVT
jgi:hypothetical protein